MAYGAGIEQEWRYQNEVTFAVRPAAWTSGVSFLCVDPDRAGMKRGNIDNNNYRQRALATRAKVPALANGSLGFKVYLHGRSTAVSANARATITTPNFPIAHFMQNAWGGIRMGYRTTIASGSTTAPVVAAGQGANYEAGDWGFFIDVSVNTAEGYFRKIASVATDTFTMWAGHPIPFTPAATDIVGAVIQCYPHTTILADPNHASHLTQSFLDMGDLADDAREATGVKLNLTGVEGIAAGEAGLLVFAGMCTQIDNDAVTQPAAGTPLGDAPVVTSTGDDTFVYIVAVGSDLALVEASTVGITPGIASSARMGVGGIEGVHGYKLTGGSGDSMQVEIIVDYDDAWNTAFDAETRYQILVQVGTQPGRAYAWFFANCELVEDPERGSEDLAVSILKFRPLESAVSTAATGDALEKVRAKAELLLSCATT